MRGYCKKKENIQLLKSSEVHDRDWRNIWETLLIPVGFSDLALLDMVDGCGCTAVMIQEETGGDIEKRKQDPILTSKIQGMRFKYYTCWINSPRMGGLNWWPRMNSCNGRRRDMRGHCTKKKIGSFYKDAMLTSKFQGICSKYFTWRINWPRIGGLTWRLWMHSCNDIDRDIRGHCKKIKRGNMQSAFIKITSQQGRFKGYVKKFYTCRINRPRGLSWGLWMYSSIFLFSILFSINHTKR